VQPIFCKTTKDSFSILTKNKSIGILSLATLSGRRSLSLCVDAYTARCWNVYARPTRRQTVRTLLYSSLC